MIGNNLLMAGDEGYNLTRSLRFRASASAYLSRTPAVSGNQRTWTWNGAFKRGDLGRLQLIFSAYGAPDADDDSFGFDASDRFFVYAATIHANLRLSTQVFKDPAAFYWVDVAMDTTNATAQNRLRVWVNGTEITTWTTNYSIPLNQLYYFNQNVPAKIGATHVPTLLLDGYLSEVNFIDGQALTPSSFGSYNSTTGVWQPAKYTGTYGTNGFYLPFSIVGGSTHAASFNGSSQSLSGTLASAIGSGNFTVEMWVNPNAVSNYNDWFGVTRGAGGFNVGTDAAGTLVFYSSSARQLNVAGVISASRYTHVAFVRSGTTLTGYVNGVSVGTATVSTNFSATGFFIGSLDNASEFNNGLISNLRVTNTAVYTANFTPPSTALTAISGTMLLTLQSATIVDNSGNSISIGNSGSVTTSVAYPFVVDLGSDFSGNNNNWATNNISLTPGVNYDSMTDVPTLTSATAANFAVLNPIIAPAFLQGAVIDNGNLRVTGAGGVSNCFARSTIGISGKMYAEFFFDVVSSASSIGVVPVNDTASSGNLSTQSTNVCYRSGGNKRVLGTETAYGASWAANDIIGVAVDTSVNTVEFFKNGTSQGVITSTSFFAQGACLFAISTDDTGSPRGYANFGQRPFSYTPPTGFVALNAYNLPDSTIKKGSTAMNIALDTGANIKTTTEALFTGQFFDWIKDLANTNNHQLMNSVRGLTAVTQSNTQSAETTYTAPSGNSVGYAWKAGASSSSNTNGTITSTTSVNASAGQAIVTYQGNATAGATFGHGLGVAPSFGIFKNLSAATDWQVYHSALGGNAASFLNTTGAANTSSLWWNNTAPTSSVMSLGSISYVNGSGNNILAMLWTEIAGYSKFGMYTGNGSADGPMIYTGMRGRWLLIKAIPAVSGGNWVLIDTANNTYNVCNNWLFPDSTTAISNYINVADINSNGFKIRSNWDSINNPSATYMYAMFAESPFKNSLAR